MVSHIGAASDWYAIRKIPIEEVDIAGVLRSARVANVHRHRPRVLEGPALAAARSKGTHLAVGDGGVWVIQACPWSWRRDDRGALQILDADDAVSELARDADDVEEVLAADGLSPNLVRPLLVSGFGEGAAFSYGRVWLVGIERLAEVLAAPGMRLSPELQRSTLQSLADCSAAGPAADPGAGEAGTRPEGGPFPIVAGQWRPKPLLVASVVTEGMLEPWMQRLHPEQVTALRRSHRGPALLRGGPGTGKTVTAIQRAAYLADRLPGPVLLVSPVRTLIGVARSQYRRLAPATIERVEVATLHGFALRLLADRGVACNVDDPGLDAAFVRAWRRVGGLGLGAWAPPEYWREEILAVVKGRGLERFEEYLGSPRPGRAVPLPLPRRRDLWELYVAYDDELARRDLQDWYDVVRLARDSLRKEPLETPYAAVIVDDVGEAPLTGLQMLHLLVGDRPDGLLLVGDATPGPLTLRAAGIEVGGRVTVLRTPHRDPAAVLEAAVALVDELDERAGDSADRVDTWPEQPGKPVRHDVTADRATHDLRLLERLRGDIADGVARGEIAVLCPNPRSAARYRRLVADEGLPVAGLRSNYPAAETAIKVGTVAEAGSRVWSAVFLPADDPLRPMQSLAELEQARSERFAAMTAARDRLWVGTVEPPPD